MVVESTLLARGGTSADMSRPLSRGIRPSEFSRARIWWRAASLFILLFSGMDSSGQTGTDARVWKSSDGKYSIEAAIVELDGNTVKLRKVDGELIGVPLDRLSESDRGYATKWMQLRHQALNAQAAAGFSTDALGEPIDLLKIIDTDRDRLKGNWTKENGALITRGETRSVLQVPQQLPEQYQLRFTVERFRGERGLNVALVVGGKPAMAVFDAWKGTSSGLTMIDNKNEQNNVTLFREKVLSKEPSEIVCTVHHRHVHVACNGKTLVQWFGRPSQLSLFKRYWSDVPTDRILLGTWGSDFRFTSLTMTPIEQSTFDDLELPAGVPDPGKSVALIEHPLGSGSGFVASRNLLVSNYHVIANAFVDDIEIHFPDRDDPLSVRQVLHEDPARDLAVLLVETDRMPLPIAYDGDFSEGDEISIHGNPSVGGGIVLRNASVTGKIVATVRIEGQDFFQVEATVNPGSSGGPILNHLGQVIGVTAMKATEEGEKMIRDEMRRLDDSFRISSQEEGVAFGIPGKELAKALDSVRTQSAMTAEQTNVRHDTRVVFQRLVTVFRLNMLKALAEASGGMQRQAAFAQSTGQTEDLVELLPSSLSRKILAELEDGQSAGAFQLHQKDLEQPIEILRGRLDVPESTKRHLVELRKHAKSAESFASNLPTNYRSFSKKLLSLQDAFAKRIARMKDDGF